MVQAAPEKRAPRSVVAPTCRARQENKRGCEGCAGFNVPGPGAPGQQVGALPSRCEFGQRGQLWGPVHLSEMSIGHTYRRQLESAPPPRMPNAPLAEVSRAVRKRFEVGRCGSQGPGSVMTPRESPSGPVSASTRWGSRVGVSIGTLPIKWDFAE